MQKALDDSINNSLLETSYTELEKVYYCSSNQCNLGCLISVKPPIDKPFTPYLNNNNYNAVFETTFVEGKDVISSEERRGTELKEDDCLKLKKTTSKSNENLNKSDKMREKASFEIKRETAEEITDKTHKDPKSRKSKGTTKEKTVSIAKHKKEGKDEEGHNHNVKPKYKAFSRGKSVKIRKSSELGIEEKIQKKNMGNNNSNKNSNKNSKNSKNNSGHKSHSKKESSSSDSGELEINLQLNNHKKGNKKHNTTTYTNTNNRPDINESKCHRQNHNNSSNFNVKNINKESQEHGMKSSQHKQVVISELKHPNTIINNHNISKINFDPNPKIQYNINNYIIQSPSSIHNIAVKDFEKSGKIFTVDSALKERLNGIGEAIEKIKLSNKINGEILSKNGKNERKKASRKNLKNYDEGLSNLLRNKEKKDSPEAVSLSDSTPSNRRSSSNKQIKKAINLGRNNNKNATRSEFGPLSVIESESDEVSKYTFRQTQGVKRKSNVSQNKELQVLLTLKEGVDHIKNTGQKGNRVSGDEKKDGEKVSKQKNVAVDKGSKSSQNNLNSVSKLNNSNNNNNSCNNNKRISINERSETTEKNKTTSNSVVPVKKKGLFFTRNITKKYKDKNEDDFLKNCFANAHIYAGNLIQNNNNTAVNSKSKVEKEEKNKLKNQLQGVPNEYRINNTAKPDLQNKDSTKKLTKNFLSFEIKGHENCKPPNKNEFRKMYNSVNMFDKRRSIQSISVSKHLLNFSIDKASSSEEISVSDSENVRDINEIREDINTSLDSCSFKSKSDTSIKKITKCRKMKGERTVNNCTSTLKVIRDNKKNNVNREKNNRAVTLVPEKISVENRNQKQKNTYKGTSLKPSKKRSSVDLDKNKHNRYINRLNTISSSKENKNKKNIKKSLSLCTNEQLKMYIKELQAQLKTYKMMHGNLNKENIEDVYEKINTANIKTSINSKNSKKIKKTEALSKASNRYNTNNSDNTESHLELEIIEGGNDSKITATPSYFLKERSSSSFKDQIDLKSNKKNKLKESLAYFTLDEEESKVQSRSNVTKTTEKNMIKSLKGIKETMQLHKQRNTYAFISFTPKKKKSNLKSLEKKASISNPSTKVKGFDRKQFVRKKKTLNPKDSKKEPIANKKLFSNKNILLDLRLKELKEEAESSSSGERVVETENINDEEDTFKRRKNKKIKLCVDTSDKKDDENLTKKKKSKSRQQKSNGNVRGNKENKENKENKGSSVQKEFKKATTQANISSSLSQNQYKKNKTSNNTSNKQQQKDGKNVQNSELNLDSKPKGVNLKSQTLNSSLNQKDSNVENTESEIRISQTMKARTPSTNNMQNFYKFKDENKYNKTPTHKIINSAYSLSKRFELNQHHQNQSQTNNHLSLNNLYDINKSNSKINSNTSTQNIQSAQSTQINHQPNFATSNSLSQTATQTQDEIVKSLTNNQNIKNFYEYMETCLEIIADMRKKPQPRINQSIDLKFPKETKKKKIALFDLDETLVHCTGDINSKQKDAENDLCKSNKAPDGVVTITLPTKKQVKVGINIRPFWKQTIDALKDKYNIVVYSASHNSYADSVLNYLDPDKKFFKYRMYRSNCVQVVISDELKFYVKDLDIFKENYNLKDIVMIDNSVLSFAYHLDNGIPIIPFYDDVGDTELYDLANYLLTIADYDDLREANKQSLKMDYYLQIAIDQLEEENEEEDEEEEDEVNSPQINDKSSVSKTKSNNRSPNVVDKERKSLLKKNQILNVTNETQEGEKSVVKFSHQNTKRSVLDSRHDIKSPFIFQNKESSFTSPLKLYSKLNESVVSRNNEFKMENLILGENSGENEHFRDDYCIMLNNNTVKRLRNSIFEACEINHLNCLRKCRLKKRCPSEKVVMSKMNQDIKEIYDLVNSSFEKNSGFFYDKKQKTKGAIISNFSRRDRSPAGQIANSKRRMPRKSFTLSNILRLNYVPSFKGHIKEH